MTMWVDQGQGCGEQGRGLGQKEFEMHPDGMMEAKMSCTQFSRFRFGDLIRYWYM